MKYISYLLFLCFAMVACQSSGTPTTAEDINAPSSKIEQRIKTPKVLPPKQFAEKVASVTDPQLIDVRTMKEYKEGFIVGAQNIDFYSSTFLNDFKSKVDPKRPVFLYCKSGGRSGKTAAMLAVGGYQEVYDLEGGYMAWQVAEQNQLPENAKIEEQ